MTQDEIIRMAQEAGYPYGERGDGTFKLLSSEEDIVEILERFAALVAAHEREKQAKQEPVAKFLDDNLVVENEWIDSKSYRILEIREEELIRLMNLYASHHVQEPVGYVYEKDVAGIGMRKDVQFTKHVEVGTDLYAAPVHTKDLTDDEILLELGLHEDNSFSRQAIIDARAVIAAYKEKNK